MAIPVVAENPQDPETGASLRISAKEMKRKQHQLQQQHHHQEHLQHQSQSPQHQQSLLRDDDDVIDWKKRFGRRHRFGFYLLKINTTNLSKLVMVTVLTTLVIHRIISTVMSRKKWINAPITYMQRKCPTFEYIPMTPQQASEQKICITTLTDAQSPSLFQRFIRWRNFDGIVELTWPNKQEYANKHGYYLFDQSHLIDTSRPPAWSKVKAVLDLFSKEDHKCDWVMWTDADTVIMNSDVQITDFLPADPKYDLLVASDKGGGYNSGVFLFRNSEWSKRTLEQWWDMKSFVRPPGLSLSGDNNAMKDLLKNMEDFDQHVLSPPRCTFNSFAKFLTLGQSLAVMDKLEEQEWYLDNEHYHKGDFIAHTPGVDNKAEALRLLLEEVSHHPKSSQQKKPRNKKKQRLLLQD